MTTKKKLEVARKFHSASIRLLRQLRLNDQKLGISSARLSVLSVLVFKGPCSLSDLADIEQVSKPTITILVRNLVNDGFVTCSQSPIDKRVVIANATKQGKKILQKGQDARVKTLAELFNNLNKNELISVDQAADIVLDLLNGQ